MAALPASPTWAAARTRPSQRVYWDWRPAASSDTHRSARSAPEMNALPPPSTTSAIRTPAKLVAAV